MSRFLPDIFVRKKVTERAYQDLRTLQFHKIRSLARHRQGRLSAPAASGGGGRPE